MKLSEFAKLNLVEKVRELKEGETGYFYHHGSDGVDLKKRN